MSCLKMIGPATIFNPSTANWLGLVPENDPRGSVYVFEYDDAMSNRHIPLYVGRSRHPRGRFETHVTGKGALGLLLSRTIERGLGHNLRVLMLAPANIFDHYSPGVRRRPIPRTVEQAETMLIRVLRPAFNRQCNPGGPHIHRLPQEIRDPSAPLIQAITTRSPDLSHGKA